MAGLALHLTSPTCPPGQHWENPTPGIIQGVRGAPIGACVPNKVLTLHLGPKPPPPPPPKRITLHLGPVTRPGPVGTGTGLTSPAPAPPPPTPPDDSAMADAPALPPAECPSGLTWPGVAAAAGGSFFLGLLVGAVAISGVGRGGKRKRGR